MWCGTVVFLLFYLTDETRGEQQTDENKAPEIKDQVSEPDERRETVDEKQAGDGHAGDKLMLDHRQVYEQGQGAKTVGMETEADHQEGGEAKKLRSSTEIELKSKDEQAVEIMNAMAFTRQDSHDDRPIIISI